MSGLISKLNGYCFFSTNTVAVHFYCKNTCVREPGLFPGNQKVEVRDEACFLGMIFDKMLNFKAHVRDLKLRCFKALRVLRVLFSNEWGSDTTKLLQLYLALICSKLDYAPFIYGSGMSSALTALGPIHHQGLRLALGPFRPSTRQSMHTHTCKHTEL